MNWVANFAVASVFLQTTQSVQGEVMTYSGLAGFALLAFVFVYYMVPETANKQID